MRANDREVTMVDEDCYGECEGWGSTGLDDFRSVVSIVGTVNAPRRNTPSVEVVVHLREP